ncbi:hypothetical protein NW755_010781 [Fusarium falciforme]|uniref:Uncharacterized protein n=1 Tax=Fusarium falciforme TaxID=195108 RepID=A0A9W8QXL1_9HYPO|nr:hypothetical protein NW755_010781 [Fusarium falciforme]
MVWTSPEESGTFSSPSHQRQASYDERNANSNTISPGSPSTSTIRSSRAAREAYAAAQRLQRTTHGYSRPSTSMSFTTSSSDRILGRSFESRSPSPSPSYISRTPTPTPPQPLLPSFPSPPEDDGYPSYSTDRSQTSAFTPQSNQSQQTSQQSYQQNSQQSSQSIPSAQPYTPVAPLSPQAMSSPSLLPSPPMTQPRDDPFRTSYPAPVPAISLLSPRRHPRPAARRFPAGPSTTTPNLNDPDSALLDSVVEGIGRIHVTMGRDDAGRWRIKRPPNMRS